MSAGRPRPFRVTKSRPRLATEADRAEMIALLGSVAEDATFYIRVGHEPARYRSVLKRVRRYSRKLSGFTLNP